MIINHWDFCLIICQKKKKNKTGPGTVERDQLVRCLLYKHEDLSSSPQNMYEAKPSFTARI